MQTLNRLTLSYPLIMITTLVLFGVLFSQLSAVLLTNLVTDISRETFVVFTKYATSGLIILMLWQFGLLRECGISTSIRDWGVRWPLALLPVLLIGCINFTGVEWADVVFNFSKVPGWIFAHMATGVFEEVLMRSMAFYLLYRAWQHKQNALIKAAIAQAVIFGSLHLLNLLNGFSVDVIAQVIYATLLGFAFAGVVAYTRSIWPAAVAHAFINAIGGINRTFVPEYVAEPNSIALYTLAISIIFLVAALPGLYMLRISNARISLAAA